MLRRVAFKDSKDFRPPTASEVSYLHRLLEPDFEGAPELREQLDHATCRRLDENGSLVFRIEESAKANVGSRVPTEGFASDADGIAIHFLLHVLDGRIEELEIYKEDCSKVLEMPRAEALELVPQIEEPKGISESEGESPGSRR